MKIGNVKLNNKYILAPMAGYTNVAFRELCAEYGTGLTVTEMISAKGLLYDSGKTQEMLKISPLESPISVQLFGSDPDDFATVLRNCEHLAPFDIVDINMGCPVNKVIRQNEGSALMKDVALAEKIVSACKKNTSKPVTVKFRLGWESNDAINFAHAMQSAGADAITVHGRTALQMYRGDCDVKSVLAIKDKVEIPLIVSGDFTAKRADLYSEFDGIMIGREALIRPDVFATVMGKEQDDSRENVYKIIMRHIAKMKEYFENERFVVSNMRKHYAYYFKRYKISGQMKNALNLAPDLKSVYALLGEIFEK